MTSKCAKRLTADLCPHSYSPGSLVSRAAGTFKTGVPQVSFWYTIPNIMSHHFFLIGVDARNRQPNLASPCQHQVVGQVLIQLCGPGTHNARCNLAPQVLRLNNTVLHSSPGNTSYGSLLARMWNY